MQRLFKENLMFGAETRQISMVTSNVHSIIPTSDIFEIKSMHESLSLPFLITRPRFHVNQEIYRLSGISLAL